MLTFLVTWIFLFLNLYWFIQNRWEFWWFCYIWKATTSTKSNGKNIFIYISYFFYEIARFVCMSSLDFLSFNINIIWLISLSSNLGQWPSSTFIILIIYLNFFEWSFLCCYSQEIYKYKGHCFTLIFYLHLFINIIFRYYLFDVLYLKETLWMIWYIVTINLNIPSVRLFLYIH